MFIDSITYKNVIYIKLTNFLIYKTKNYNQQKQHKSLGTFLNGSQAVAKSVPQCKSYCSIATVSIDL